MADRTSAEIFGTIFEMLAENITDEQRLLALRIYKLSQRYDFTECQMDADDACLALGIARKGINPEYPEEVKVIQWPGDPGYETIPV